MGGRDCVTAKPAGRRRTLSADRENEPEERGQYRKPAARRRNRGDVRVPRGLEDTRGRRRVGRHARGHGRGVSVHEPRPANGTTMALRGAWEGHGASEMLPRGFARSADTRPPWGCLGWRGFAANRGSWRSQPFGREDQRCGCALPGLRDTIAPLPAERVPPQARQRRARSALLPSRSNTRGRRSAEKEPIPRPYCFM
jgi:hypothetical protein